MKSLMIYYGCWARKYQIFLESKKFNVQNTMGDTNIIFKTMYERSKKNQLNYYPELKL